MARAETQSVELLREQLLTHLPSWKSASFRKDPYSWQDQVLDFAVDEGVAASSTLAVMAASYFSYNFLRNHFGPFLGQYGSLVSDIAVDGITTSNWPELWGRMAVTTGTWMMSDTLPPAAALMMRYLFSHWQLFSSTLPDIWQSFLPHLKGQQEMLCGREDLCRAIRIRYRLPDRHFAPDTGKPWLEISFPFDDSEIKPESQYEKALIGLRDWAREQGVSEIHLYPDSNNGHRTLWVRSWEKGIPGSLIEFPAHFSAGAQSSWWTEVMADKKPEQRAKARKLINPLHINVIAGLPAVLSGTSVETLQAHGEEHFVSGGKNMMAVSSGKDGFIMFDRYTSQGYELPEVWLISSLPLNHVMKQALRSLDIRRVPPPWRGGWKLTAEVVRSSAYRAMFDWVIAQLKTEARPSQKQSKDNAKKAVKKGSKKVSMRNKSKVKQKVVPLPDMENEDDDSDREDVYAPEDILSDDESDEADPSPARDATNRLLSKRKAKLDYFSLELMEKRLSKIEEINKMAAQQENVRAKSREKKKDVSGRIRTQEKSSDLKSSGTKKQQKKVRFKLPKPVKTAGEQRVLVLGKPGVGKSTMIRWIAKGSADSMKAIKDKNNTVGRYQEVTINGVNVLFSEVSVAPEDIVEGNLPRGIEREIQDADKVIWCGNVRDERSPDMPDSNTALFRGVLEYAAGKGEKPVYVAMTHGNQIVSSSPEEQMERYGLGSVKGITARRDFQRVRGGYRDVRDKLVSKLENELMRTAESGREDLKKVESSRRELKSENRKARKKRVQEAEAHDRDPAPPSQAEIHRKEKIKQLNNKINKLEEDIRHIKPPATLTDMLVGLTGQGEDDPDMIYTYLTADTEGEAKVLAERPENREAKARELKVSCVNKDVTDWHHFWRLLISRDDQAQRQRTAKALDGWTKQIRSGVRDTSRKIWRMENR